MNSHVDSALVRGAQNCMVKILLEIDRVCQKHGLKWWMIDGTLLGAIRHRDFIPWDDDCDIAMMREDYEKFVKVARFDLDNNFVFQSRESDPTYPKRLSKVRMKGTKLVEIDEDTNEKYFQGVFVDIYIWDYFYSFDKIFLYLFNIMPGIRSGRTKYPKHSLKRALHGLMTAVPYAIHRLLELLYLGFRCLVRKNKNLPYLSVEAQMSNEIFFKKDVLFPLHREYFSGEYFPAPSNTEAYLTAVYGNYMELPPEEDRFSHARLIEVQEEYLD